MNTKDKMQLLKNAIQSLMTLYQALDDEMPKLCAVNSELKKITWKTSSVFLQRRLKTTLLR